MTYTDFQNKWIGKRVDYDGVYGFQCVDLIKQYLAECYGLSPGAWGNAIDYWKSTNVNILTKFTKVASNDAKQGDIVVLNGTSGNPYGHIGIATGAIDATNVEILEQNGSTGNASGTGGDAIRKRFVARSRVAGLLRPKESDVITNNDRGLIDRLSQRLRLWNPGYNMDNEMKAWAGQDFRKFLDEGMNEADAEFKRREQALNQVNVLNGQVNSLNGAINGLNASVSDLTLKLNGKQLEVNDLQDDVAKLKAENEALKAQNAAVSGDTDLLNSIGSILAKFIARIGLKK